MLSDEQVKIIMFDIEKSENILQYKVDGVSFYYLLRFSIEIDLRAENFGRNNKRQRNIFSILFQRVIRVIRKLYERKKDTALFDDPGGIAVSPLLFISPSNYTNKEGIGPHLIDIIEYYYRQGYPINFIQRTDFSAPTFPKKSVYYHNFIAYDLKQDDNLSNQVYQDLRIFLKLISDRTKVDFTTKSDIYYSQIVRIIGESNQLYSYILKSKAQYIYTYSVYTEPGILLACKKAKVKLIEVQHGVLLKDSIYFQSALGKTALDKSYLLMPDYIFTLGSEWRDILINQNTYFNEKNVFVIGTTKFDKWKNSLNQRNNAPIRVVFFSQGRGYSNILSISDFIEFFLQKCQVFERSMNIEIVLRPHPNDLGEFTLLARKYSSLTTLESSFKKDSLESIADADIIFSASSMCLYEAIALGKIPVSLDKFSGILRKEHIKLVRSVDELLDFISQYPQQPRLQNPIPYLEAFNSKCLNEFMGQSVK